MHHLSAWPTPRARRPCAPGPRRPRRRPPPRPARAPALASTDLTFGAITGKQAGGEFRISGDCGGSGHGSFCGAALARRGFDLAVARRARISPAVWSAVRPSTTCTVVGDGRINRRPSAFSAASSIAWLSATCRRRRVVQAIDQLQVLKPPRAAIRPSMQPVPPDAAARRSAGASSRRGLQIEAPDREAEHAIIDDRVNRPDRQDKPDVPGPCWNSG